MIGQQDSAVYLFPRTERKWAPCRSKCPVHVDVPAYLAAVAEGRFSEALEIVLERNPLPSVCGRVCLRPCEEGCRRCLLDEPVAVASIKRAAADHGVYPAVQRPEARPERIAIVGSGPAGLTAAHDLAKQGFGVTIYESKHKLGGMLRYGIPMYRLPDYALDRDIDHILSWGVDVCSGVSVGRDVSLDELRGQYDAVLLAVGLQGSRPLPIEGADLPGVWAALPFLEASVTSTPPAIGDRVVVVGGGNVAMDVARTARRLGAKHVTAVCLEGRDIMPASEHEIHEAEAEGVRVRCAFGPKAVLGKESVEGLRVVSCTSVFDAEGRFSPTFDECTLEDLPADTVIFAVGQGADARDLGVDLTPRGMIEVDRRTLATSVSGVFASGDVTVGPTKIIDAVAAGHRVAAAIVSHVTGDGEQLDALDAEGEVVGEVPEHMATKLETRRRVQMERLEFYEAVKTFAEVESGYTEYEAAREAQRCLSCTTGARLTLEKCASCLTCTRVCPNGAPVFQPGGYPYFSAEACHACGACAAECPGSAIEIEGCNEGEMKRRVGRHLEGADAHTSIAFVCGYSPELLDHIDPTTRIVTVPCLLRVSERVVFEAFETGAERVVFTRCDSETCRFPHAMELVANRVDRIRALAAEVALGDAFVVAGADGEERSA